MGSSFLSQFLLISILLLILINLAASISTGSSSKDGGAAKPKVRSSNGLQLKEQEQVLPYPPLYPNPTITCACGVFGQRDVMYSLLEVWARRSQFTTGMGGGGPPRHCQGVACYRADIITMYPYRAHYWVLGCTNPVGLGTAGFEHKYQQNVSMAYFLSDPSEYPSQWSPAHSHQYRNILARHILELACTHPFCQHMDPGNAWFADQYHWKMNEILHYESSASRPSITGPGILLVILFISTTTTMMTKF